MKKIIRLTESELVNVVKNVINETCLYESTMDRIEMWLKNHECAFITAWRTKYVNVTERTFEPKHIGHDKDHRGMKYEKDETFVVGDTFTTEEKKYYNRQLKASLLSLGFGVTNVRGVFREEGCTGCDSGQEESFFVVNKDDKAGFKEALFKLSEYYNQDCFMYSPKGSIEAYNIGTNFSEWPGYGNEEPAGKFNKHVQSMFMSRIGNQGFSFGNPDDMEDDKPKTFADRKAARMQKNFEKRIDEALDRIEYYNIGARRSIYDNSREVLKRLFA